MRRPFYISGVLAAIGAVPFVIALVVRPGDRARAADIYVLFLGALLLLALARVTAEGRRKARPSLLDREEERSARPTQLPELARVEREVVLGTAREFDLYMRIRPLLRDVAEHRLWSRRGIDLELEPERAREALGTEAWDLVRPDRPAPDERFRAGLGLAGLRQVVDTIEEI
jgi:hypothetical protein